jgi:hypothetical protein
MDQTILRRQRLVESLHRLGPRPLYEFIVEIITKHGIAGDVDARLESYAAIDRRVLEALGGTEIVSPLHNVGK